MGWLRLEDDGVVRGYRSDIDPRQLGYPQIASVSASPALPATSPPPTCVTSATPQTPRELQYLSPTRLPVFDAGPVSEDHDINTDQLSRDSSGLRQFRS
jgi:DNA-binding Lrp family transcriptional regulator